MTPLSLPGASKTTTNNKHQHHHNTTSCVAVYPERRVVEAVSEDGLRFYVPYDKLAICTGSQGSTFGIPGVEEHTHFLRDLRHAEVRLRPKACCAGVCVLCAAELARGVECACVV